jgi:hypothetical protein
MKKVIIFACLSVLFLSHCGQKNDKAADESLSTLPDSTVMIVPVDANGVEDTSKAEMRTVNGSVADKSNEELLAMYDSGAKIEKTIDSDSFDESSTQAWFGWNKHRGQSQCGARNFCDFQPAVVSGGSQHRYQQVTQSTVQCAQVRTTCCQVRTPCCPQVQQPSCQQGPSSPTYRVGYRGEGSNQQPGSYLSPFIGPSAYNIYGWQRQVL